MAFFLLMWLLGATTEKQRKGIADYFNPTVPINKSSGGGDGSFGGDSVFTDNSLARNGTGAGAALQAQGNMGEDTSEAPADTAVNSGDDALEGLADMLSGKSGESMVSDLLRRHVVTKLTDEGLIVEVFDLPDAPLFTGEAEATAVLQDVVVAVAEVFRLATNEIAIQGYTASVPLAARTNPVWTRSAARANAARQLLIDSAIESERLQRVTGFADRKPVSEDLLSVRNNRIEFILLRHRF